MNVITPLVGWIILVGIIISVVSELSPARKWSLRQGNVFTPVCKSFCSHGSVHPTRQTPSLPGQTSPQADPLGRHRPNPRRQLKWAVRMLLECILVIIKFKSHLFFYFAYFQVFVKSMALSVFTLFISASFGIFFPSCLIICKCIGVDVHICRAWSWYVMNANSYFSFWDRMCVVMPGTNSFANIDWRHQSFCGATGTPVLDFWFSKPGWIPLLACFVICMQQSPQIHFWCNTCWPLGSQHGSQAVPVNVLELFKTVVY